MGYLRLTLLLLLLMLQPSFTAAADKDAELKNLYNALNMLNQQQQAIYQQFRMVQELRRSSLPLYGAPMFPQFPGPPASYDEVVAAQKNAIRHDEELSQQADRLLDKYNEIEEMKKPLQQKIYGLTQGK